MSSGFVSEAEIAEKRRVRQEEWEKVRQPHQPAEVPEESFDPRSLFDRLEEQKQKKQQDYEEAHKLKNMIKGLDDDEVQFLDLIDQKKLEAEQIKEREEQKELIEFRKKVEELRNQTLDQRIQTEIRLGKQMTSVSSSSKTQQQLLKGVVVKRKVPVAAQPEICAKKMKQECDNLLGTGTVSSAEERLALAYANKADKADAGADEVESAADIPDNACCELKRKRQEDEASPRKIGLTCVGILPSLCSYAESSDESDHSCSSSSDVEETTSPTKYDLVGRKILYKTKEAGHSVSK